MECFLNEILNLMMFCGTRDLFSCAWVSIDGFNDIVFPHLRLSVWIYQLVGSIRLSMRYYAKRIGLNKRQ